MTTLSMSENEIRLVASLITVCKNEIVSLSDTDSHIIYAFLNKLYKKVRDRGLKSSIKSRMEWFRVKQKLTFEVYKK